MEPRHKYLDAERADFGGIAKYGAVGFSIGNKGYIGTGFDSWFTQDFWEYYDSLSTTSILEHPSSLTVNVYPNPSSEQFIATFHVEDNDAYIVRATNTIGQIIYEENLDNFRGTYFHKIDITTYGKGVYLLSVSNSKNQTVKKVIVY